VDRREECKIGDSIIKKADIDEKILERARATERKLKRLTMAKYSKDLFDEIVEEMLKEKRT
jgi:hypothetical protein